VRLHELNDVGAFVDAGVVSLLLALPVLACSQPLAPSAT
jgi:hypothetical protein